LRRRKGLVSNSSSVCFILDLRNPEARLLAEECIAARLQCVRRTGILCGDSTKAFAARQRENGSSCLGDWLLRHHRKLGENIAVLCENDEGNGGFLFSSSGSATRLFAALDSVEDPTRAARWGSLLPDSDPYVRLVRLAIDYSEFHE
jgi:hypothetical protein